MNTLNKIFIKSVGIFMLNFLCVINYVTAETHILTVCDENYYVSKCGSVTIGTNILKGFNDPTNGHEWNYYDYSGKNNMKNLHYFFSGTEPIKYRSRVGAVGWQTIAANTYIPNRNALLRNTCNPIGNSSSFFKCTACPHGGKVAKSTIEVELINGVYNVNDAANSGAWALHTFADCHKDKFTDATGTFKYIDDNSNDLSCYYNIENVGDALASDSWDNVTIEDLQGSFLLIDDTGASVAID